MEDSSQTSFADSDFLVLYKKFFYSQMTYIYF